MDHKFLSSATFLSVSDTTKCAAIVGNRLCGHPEVAHTDHAECDYCDYVGVVSNDANNGLACPNCLNKVVPKVYIKTEAGTISINEVLKKSKEVDYGLGIKTDIFNANTVSIQEIREAVYADDNIPVVEKMSTIAGMLYDRIKHYQKLIFDKSEEVRDLNSTQRQYQVELNKIANELRADERAKYQAIDINYKPNKVSDKFKDPDAAKPVKRISVKKKIDKDELKKAAAEIGVAEYTLQALCVAQNLSVDDAAQKLRIVMKKSKEAMTNTGT